jgi:23S rRNA (guanosine2251-2'-O)-methyltransferase
MLVYGKQVCLYIASKHPHMIDTIYLAKKVDTKIFRKFSSLNIKIVTPDSQKAQAMAQGGNHQGFLLTIKEFEYVPLRNIIHSKFILVLDGLNDMGNIGSICRTSYALGVDAVVICGIKDIKIANIVRTSSGAVLDIPICKSDSIGSLLNELSQKEFCIVGADTSGYCHTDIKLDDKNKLALVVGAEGAGLCKQAKAKLNKKVKISMANSFDSLNVSVATGILIESIRRKI